MKTITLAIDAMGGDHGLSVVIPACVRAAQNNPSLKMILVGDQSKIIQHLKDNGCSLASHKQFSIEHASEVVEMDELPSHALRNKKDSSMRVAINLVKDKKAQACVSAGNTGALMATARFVLKTMPGIDRPAIISELKKLGADDIIVFVGGVIPRQDYDFLYEAGVKGIYGPGTPIPASAKDVLENIRKQANSD